MEEGRQKLARSGEILELKPRPNERYINAGKAGGATALPAPMVVTPQRRLAQAVGGRYDFSRTSFWGSRNDAAAKVG